LGSQFLNSPYLPLYFRIDLRLMVVVIGKGSIDLCQRKMWVLAMNFLRIPSIRDLIEHHFDDFGVRIVDPGHTSLVEINVCGFRC
jgi:hypothetical protein